jgi:hypothetical protein
MKRIDRSPANILKIAWDKSVPEPNSGCWLWLGMILGKYPGSMRRVNGIKTGGSFTRMVCEAVHGKMASDIVTRHTCDVPLCVNPEHLIPGTPTDNAQDCVKRGRKHHPLGEINAMATLTEDDVKNIRAARNVIFARDLAAKYNVTKNYIYQIWIGRRWQHVA